MGDRTAKKIDRKFKEGVLQWLTQSDKKTKAIDRARFFVGGFLFAFIIILVAMYLQNII